MEASAGRTGVGGDPRSDGETPGATGRPQERWLQRPPPQPPLFLQTTFPDRRGLMPAVPVGTETPAVPAGTGTEAGCEQSGCTVGHETSDS